MLADLWFHLSQLLISSCVFSRSGGTGTELADLGPVWADEEARAVLEPEPVSQTQLSTRSQQPYRDFCGRKKGRLLRPVARGREHHLGRARHTRSDGSVES